MNYIKRLETENASLKRQLRHANQDLNHLMSYLLSSKFHVDPTVQTADVLTRLGPVRSSIFLPDRERT